MARGSAALAGTHFTNNSITSDSRYALYVKSGSHTNTFLGNIIQGDSWVDDLGSGNVYNDSTTGNVYYLGNGTGAWEVYNITSSTGSGWADAGSDLPFSSSLSGDQWSGNGADWHPYTLNTLSTCVNLSDSFTYGANVSGNMSSGLSVTGSITMCPGSYVFPGVTALSVTEPNVTIDCAGSSINDSNPGTGNGVNVQADWATIENCSISNFEDGISMASQNNITIEGNTISNSSSAAILGYGAPGWVHATDNLMYDNNVGIMFGAVYQYDIISGNQIYDSTINAMQIMIINSSVISDNVIYNVSGGPDSCGCSGPYCSDKTCGEGISANRVTDSNFTNNTITYTFASGIGFVDSQQNLISGGEIGEANDYYAANWDWIQFGGGIWYDNVSSNNTATGIYMHNDTGGAFDVLGDYNTIQSNNLVHNCGGVQQIDCLDASNLTIINNNITDGTGSGINAYSCQNLNISGNHIDRNALYGIQLYANSFDWVQGNTFENNTEDAIYLIDSDYDTFLGNTIQGSYWVTDDGTGNAYNDSTTGNIYYLANGTGAWDVYNITSSTNSSWADSGSDLPFNSSTQVGIDGYWSGNGADWHPATTSGGNTGITLSVQNPVGSVIQNESFSVDLNVSCAGPECGPMNVSLKGSGGNRNIYVLQGGDTECADDIQPILESAGYSVTCGMQTPDYDGSLDLSPYAAVIVLDESSYLSVMPEAGQDALNGYVANGGGLIIFEWSAFNDYNFTIANRIEGYTKAVNYSLLGSSPVTSGLPDSWIAPTCGYSTLSPTGSATAIVQDTTDGTPIVVVNDTGTGKVVQFGMAPGYISGCWNSSSGWDTNMTALLKNAVGWVARVGLVPVGSGTPFYADSNPQQITVGDGESQMVVFQLNAAGNPGTYGLEADAVLLSDNNVNSTSAPWDVTIEAYSPPNPETGHSTSKSSVQLSESFNCSSGQLTVSSGVPGLMVSLIPLANAGSQQAQTDSSGEAVFTVASSGSYELYSQGTSDYLSATANAELDLCPVPVVQPQNQTPITQTPQCTEDSMCDQGQQCVDQSCAPIECSCGQIENHACVPYACCYDSDCASGQSCQDHSCVAQQITQNQTPPANVTTGPTQADASAAIAAATAAIDSASSSGKDVSAAQSELAQAQAALSSGNFALAVQMADQAKQSANAAAAPASNPSQTVTVELAALQLDLAALDCHNRGRRRSGLLSDQQEAAQTQVISFFYRSCSASLNQAASKGDFFLRKTLINKCISNPFMRIYYLAVLMLVLANLGFAYSCVNLSDSSTYQGIVSGDNVTTGFSINGSIILCYGTYTFGNVMALQVTEPNVTIDCKGSSIVGSGTTYAVYSDQNNTVIENCNLSHFARAIFFTSNTNGTIKNITASATVAADTILLYQSSNNTIANSTVIAPGDNLVFYISSNNTIVNTTFESSSAGGPLVSIDSASGGNVFYWDNFTGPATQYVNDVNGSNIWNGSSYGIEEGNIWGNVINYSVSITSNPSIPSGYGSGLFVGNNGNGYPYNNAHSLGMVSAGVIDYAPLVPYIYATPVDLGAASNFAILAYSGITNTGNSIVIGDIGSYPTSTIIGFPPGTLIGTDHSNDSVSNESKVDLATAYNNITGRTCNTVLTGEDLGSLSPLTPGVYCFSSSAGLTGTLTLNGEGDPDSVFIFQIGSTLTTASSSKVVLVNGANASNVFWQLGSSATLGTGTNFSGNILAAASIAATTGANVGGRLLAQNGAVTLDDNNVSLPIPAYSGCVNLSDPSTYQGNVTGSMGSGFMVSGSIVLCNDSYPFSGVTALTVIEPNVTIDCNGSQIINGEDSGTYGVYSEQVNTNVENCSISDFYDDIYLDEMSGGAIVNDDLGFAQTGEGPSGYGIYLYAATGVNISEDHIHDNSAFGVYLDQDSDSNWVMYNNISNNNEGIYLYYADDNQIGYNYMSGQYTTYGSCPFLYLKNGSDYSYYTDLAGEMLGLSVFNPQKYQAGIYELGNFTPTDGVYDMKVREVIPESDYFDQAKLVLVDVPQGYGVLNQWSWTYAFNQVPDEDFMTIHDPMAPISATDNYGNDVLPQVSAKDGVPVPVYNRMQNPITLDFGSIENPQYAKLIVTGWGEYSAYPKLTPQHYLLVQTKNANGTWVTRKAFGGFIGDSRTIVYNLSGILEANDTLMRIIAPSAPTTINMVDQVLLDDSPPVNYTVTYVDPSDATLQWGGSTSYDYPTVDHRNTNVTDDHGPAIPNDLMYGNFTKYGDVLPLLSSSDDQFVVMRSGDELHLQFNDAPKIDGTDRYVFLLADDMYSIKSSINGFIRDSVDPLPFHGMSAYPYPANESYPDDSAHQDYMAEWNTRDYAEPASNTTSVDLPYSFNNTVFNNTIIGGYPFSIGLMLQSETDTQLLDNYITGVGTGISSDSSVGTLISGNIINASNEGTGTGIYLGGENYAEYAQAASHGAMKTEDDSESEFQSTISNNVIISDDQGIQLVSGSTSTLVFGNIMNTSGTSIYLADGSVGNMFLHNNITSDYWVDDEAGGNAYNDSTSGNIYYDSDGTPSWQVYNISDTNDDSWADTGSDLPFNASLYGGEWTGNGADWHPFVGPAITVNPDTGHQTTKSPVRLSESFNCSSGQLTVSSGVPGLTISLIPVSASGSQQAQTDSSGDAIFTVTNNDSYELYTPGSSDYLSASTDPFELDLCPAITPQCTEDSMCNQDQRCVNQSCVPIICSCGYVQGHACVPYACCLDSDCASGESCKDHVCQSPTPQNTHECASDSDCAGDQSCSRAAGAQQGSCEAITGCGAVANHVLTPYQCGSGPGCPSCGLGQICMDNACKSFDLKGPDSGFVGNNASVQALEDNTTCAGCDLKITDPSGKTLTGKTDASGDFSVPLDMIGTYTVAYLRNGTVVKTVEIHSMPGASPLQQTPPTLTIMQVVEGTFTVLIVIVIIGGVTIIIRRPKRRFGKP